LTAPTKLAFGVFVINAIYLHHSAKLQSENTNKNYSGQGFHEMWTGLLTLTNMSRDTAHRHAEAATRISNSGQIQAVINLM